MKFLDTAIKAAKIGGAVLERYFETSLVQEVKDDNSFVTVADREAEQAVVSAIKKEFPDHGFLGEEGGETLTDSLYQWVIDPLDGTSNFVNGLPIFAVSIALLEKGKSVASVVYNPPLKLLFSAARGKGAFCNDIAMRVSTQDEKSAMITYGVGRGAGIKDYLIRLFHGAPKQVKGYRYLGAVALELAYLARGGTEGVINLGTEKWDYAAGSLLVEEAGGKITDFKGNPWTFSERFFVASNGLIHDSLLKLVEAAGNLPR